MTLEYMNRIDPIGDEQVISSSRPLLEHCEIIKSLFFFSLASFVKTGKRLGTESDSESRRRGRY